MEFFNKIKAKITAKKLLMVLLFLVFAVAFVLIAVSNGFSSDMDYAIGVRGSSAGIPVPNWLLSVGALLLAALFFVCFVTSSLSVFKNEEYKEFLRQVRNLGDVQTVGATVAAMPKCPYAKGGDLRYDAGLLFCAQGTDVGIVSAAQICRISTEATGSKSDHLVCVHSAAGVLKIKVKAKYALPFLEDLKRLYPSAF